MPSKNSSLKTRAFSLPWLGCALLPLASPAEVASPAAPANPLVSSEGRVFADRLAPHDSIYFLIGTGTPAAKFQFSFKYRLIEFGSGAEDKSRGNTLNLAYTQRSLWDTEADSSPFYDTSYMPEVFWESSGHVARWGRVTWFGWQAGAKHESNGRDGIQSRSLNTAYLRPVFAIGPTDGWHAIFAPEIFDYIFDLENNPDLADFRGHLRLQAAIARGDGPALAVMAYAGDDFDHLTYQLDLTIPVRVPVLDLAAFFQIQYFDGYGESLLSYDTRSDAIRFGISLVR